MPTLKVLNQKGKYHDLDARETVARYILNPLKAENGLVGGVGIMAGEDIAASMNSVAMHFKKESGVQLRHFVLSFSPEELDDPIIVYQIAYSIATFIGQEYQVIFAVHENTPNLHIHFMFNSISYVDGHRYYGKKKDYYQLVNFIKELFSDYYGFILQTVSCRSESNIQ